jgi:RND family efflux transporter MFP subunit
MDRRFVVSILLALFVLSCAPNMGKSAETTTTAPRARRGVDVQVQTLPMLVLAGTTTTTRRFELSFRSGGVVQQVNVEEGTRVRRGQVLARLDLTELAAVTSQAEEGLARAKRVAARTQALADGKAGNRSDAEDAATGVVLAQAQLDAAVFSRERGIIIAPCDGRIERRLSDPGEVAGPGQPVLVLARTNAATEQPMVTAKAFVDDRSARFVAVGSSADTVVDGAALKGVVTRIGGIAVAGQIELEVRFDGAPRELPTGVPLKLSVMPSRSALAVPAAALLDADARRAFIIDASNPGQPVAVSVLAMNEQVVFVEPNIDAKQIQRVLLPTL